jgi:hypothetical protein
MEQTVLALSTYGTRDSINKVRMRRCPRMPRQRRKDIEHRLRITPPRPLRGFTMEVQAFQYGAQLLSHVYKQRGQKETAAK